MNKDSGVGEGQRRADLLAHVQTVLAAHLGVAVEYINPDTHFWNDLGLDWLDTVELIMLVEEQFPNFKIAERGDIVCLADLVRHIRIVERSGHSTTKWMFGMP